MNNQKRSSAFFVSDVDRSVDEVLMAAESHENKRRFVEAVIDGLIANKPDKPAEPPEDR